jgi:hypothetical protein
LQQNQRSISHEWPFRWVSLQSMPHTPCAAIRLKPLNRRRFFGVISRLILTESIVPSVCFLRVLLYRFFCPIARPQRRQFKIDISRYRLKGTHCQEFIAVIKIIDFF